VRSVLRTVGALMTGCERIPELDAAEVLPRKLVDPP
jgi:hypothetical protein